MWACERPGGRHDARRSSKPDRACSGSLSPASYRCVRSGALPPAPRPSQPPDIAYGASRTPRAGMCRTVRALAMVVSPLERSRRLKWSEDRRVIFDGFSRFSRMGGGLCLPGPLIWDRHASVRARAHLGCGS